MLPGEFGRHGWQDDFSWIFELLMTPVVLSVDGLECVWVMDRLHTMRRITDLMWGDNGGARKGSARLKV